MIFAFDFDGTLADTMPALTKLGTEVITTYYGVEPKHAKMMYLSTIGVSFPEQLEELFPDDPVNADAASTFWDGHLRTYIELNELFPNVEEMLESLLNSGHVCWVVTSSPRALLSSAARLLPLPVRILGREVGDKVAQLKRAQADVFFGDTARDAGFAVAAGCDFVLVNRGDAPPLQNAVGHYILRQKLGHRAVVV